MIFVFFHPMGIVCFNHRMIYFRVYVSLRFNMKYNISHIAKKFNTFCRDMSPQSCEYCYSFEIVEHSEGATCSSCCRVQTIPHFTAFDEGSGDKLEPDKFKNLSEIGVLLNRYLISEEVAISSKTLFYQLRKCNVNLAATTLLVFTLHQAMIKHIGSCFSIRQLSSLLAVVTSPNILIKHYAKLWEKFPEYLKFSPFHPKYYIPLHMLLSHAKTRKWIFITAYKLYKKSGYILELPTCVFVVIKKKAIADLDEELLQFICNFPRKKHISHGETLYMNTKCHHN